MGMDILDLLHFYDALMSPNRPKKSIFHKNDLFSKPSAGSYFYFTLNASSPPIQCTTAFWLVIGRGQ